MYTLLLPSIDHNHLSFSFQQEFVLAGGIQCILKMFSSNFLLDADVLIKRYEMILVFI